MQQTFCYIVSAGSTPKEDAFYAQYFHAQNRQALVIAVDAGWQVLHRIGQNADVLLGDLDSIAPEMLAKAREQQVAIYPFPADKDRTDTQLAIDFAIARGISEIEILGGIGSRLDHTLANCYLIHYAHEQQCQVTLIHPSHRVSLVTAGQSVVISNKNSEFVSLLPLSSQIEGVQLQGFRWDLQNATIAQGSSLGISNEILAQSATVSLTKGKALLLEVTESSLPVANGR